MHCVVHILFTGFLRVQVELLVKNLLSFGEQYRDELKFRRDATNSEALNS